MPHDHRIARISTPRGSFPLIPSSRNAMRHFRLLILPCPSNPVWGRGQGKEEISFESKASNFRTPSSKSTWQLVHLFHTPPQQARWQMLRSSRLLGTMSRVLIWMAWQIGNVARSALYGHLGDRFPDMTDVKRPLHNRSSSPGQRTCHDTCSQLIISLDASLIFLIFLTSRSRLAGQWYPDPHSASQEGP